MRDVVILDYGAGNVQSLQYALNRLGVKARLTSIPDEVLVASHVFFPGVGHAASAMASLRATGLAVLIPELTQPVLGICLGMQLMCCHSEEGDTAGLCIFDTDCRAFRGQIPAGLPIPQMGWNTLAFNPDELIFQGIERDCYQYFVHSYCVPVSQYTVATCTYGIPFSAALRKDNFCGVQFHPEKGSAIGQQILANFLNQ